MTTATAPLANGKPASRLAGYLAQHTTTTGRKLPSRIVLYTPEKWGKTTFGAHTPRPYFMCSRGETGIETLIDNGQIAPTPFTVCDNWQDTMATLAALVTEDHNYQSLVIDVGNGFCRMCEEHVCDTKFRGDWTEAGYGAFGAGIKAAISPWTEFRDRLDRIRETRRMAILMLCHTGTKTCTNPEGANYDQYRPDMPAQLWGIINKWADAILCGAFYLATEQKRGDQKAKAKGGDHRVIFTQPTAARVAGGRYRLPPMIECGTSPADAWTNFVTAMKQRPPQPADKTPAE